MHLVTFTKAIPLASGFSIDHEGRKHQAKECAIMFARYATHTSSIMQVRLRANIVLAVKEFLLEAQLDWKTLSFDTMLSELVNSPCLASSRFYGPSGHIVE